MNRNNRTTQTHENFSYDDDCRAARQHTTGWRKKMILCVIFAVIAFAMFLAPLAGAPTQAQGYYQSATLAATPAAATVTPTNTPLPPEFIANSQQTIGITFAGAVLVLIVVIGVFVFLPKKVEN